MTKSFRAAMLLTVVVVEAASMTAGNQPVQRPDFSGKWKAAEQDADAATSPFGAAFAVTQSGDQITFSSSTKSFTYRLDGADHKSAIQTARGDSWPQTIQARMVSFAIVVTTKTERPDTGGSWEDLTVVSLDDPNVLSIVAVSTQAEGGPVMSTRTFKFYRPR